MSIIYIGLLLFIIGIWHITFTSRSLTKSSKQEKWENFYQLFIDIQTSDKWLWKTRLVILLNTYFSYFKYIYTHLNILFHSHVYQKHSKYLLKLSYPKHPNWILETNILSPLSWSKLQKYYEFLFFFILYAFLFFYIICRTYCWVCNFEHIRGMNDGVIYFLVIDIRYGYMCSVGRQTFLLKKK